VLSADFSRLGEQVAEVVAAGATTVQIDVMDGRFVPNLTVGLPVVEALRKSTGARLDVHLMNEEPGIWVDRFVAAGADILTLHVEATRHLHRDVARIRALGAQAGAALNPATPLDALDEVLPMLDVALIMTVNPGFGGQTFIAGCLGKIERLRARIDQGGLAARIQVDGGIDTKTVGPAVRAGAEDLVAGSAIFGAGVPIAQAYAALADAVRAAEGGLP
jgi:ribulose-phosphate 3-epimerase